MVTEKDLQMSVGDIVQDYRQAANKNKQIIILADMNMCSRREIAQLLKDAGEELPKAWEEALTKPEKKPRTPKEPPADPTLTVQDLRCMLEDLPDDCPILSGGKRLQRVAYTRGYDATAGETRYCLEVE